MLKAWEDELSSHSSDYLRTADGKLEFGNMK
jgi:hypothetical protein